MPHHVNQLLQRTVGSDRWPFLRIQLEINYKINIHSDLLRLDWSTTLDTENGRLYQLPCTLVLLTCGLHCFKYIFLCVLLVLCVVNLSFQVNQLFFFCSFYLAYLIQRYLFEKDTVYFNETDHFRKELLGTKQGSKALQWFMDYITNVMCNLAIKHPEHFNAVYVISGRHVLLSVGWGS